MSDFKFPCPKCGQHIVCDTSNAGMNIACPACQTTITVPQPPQAAPIAPTPGKLSINKSAHSAAPSGIHQAPQTAWTGNRPAAPVGKAKTKKAVKTWITIGSILIVAAIGWFAIAAPMLKQRAEKIKQAQEEADRQAEAQRKAAEEAAAKARRPKAAWNLDETQLEFPDQKAAGKLHGVNFMAETALFKNGVLTLRQDSASRQFLIRWPSAGNESLAGKSVEIATNTTDHPPQIILNWVDAGRPLGTQSFIKGYALKLEMGAAGANGKIPGKIFLSVPDAEQSFVAGTFEIGAKKTLP